MQPEHFDIGNHQSRPLDHGKDLRKRGLVCARKDVFTDERVDGTRAVRIADRMEQRDAVRGKRFTELCKKLSIIPLSNVLKHADGDDQIVYDLVSLLIRVKALLRRPTISLDEKNYVRTVVGEYLVAELSECEIG